MNEEDDLMNLFGKCHEMSIIKDAQLFKLLRYFSPILELKHKQPPFNDDEYETVGNGIFILKEFIMQFIIDFKMYKGSTIHKLESVWVSELNL
jgi:hypothetical protein